MNLTLLLNADYNPISILPLSVVNWQHAVKLYFLGRVEILESYPDRLIRSEHLTMNVPSVCITKEYFNYRKTVKFSRTNVFLRDLYTCAYCQETFDSKELTLDHVIPRASGGKTNWENIVTSCKPCNYKKGTKLWKPTRNPYKPDYYSLISHWKFQPFQVKHQSWNKYLGIVETTNKSLQAGN